NGVWRDDFASGNGAPPLFYRPNSTSCTINSGAGDDGSQVPAAGGGCWNATFERDIDIREFGADSTGTNDSVPAVNAALALGSNHKIIFPPGTYLIGSTSTSPYPLVTGPIGFHLWCTSASPCSNIEIDGEGATITTSNSVNNSDWFGFAYLNH